MAKTEDVKTGELVEAKQSGGALEQVPAWMDKDDRTGLESITSDDIRLPRLGIAQGLSPQIQPGDSQFIPGLSIGDMFNDLTGEIYGPGPLKFIPVQRDERRIEFIPRTEGGGVRDLNVPKGDERLEWSEDSQGNRMPPRATTFVEFIGVLPKQDGSFEPIVVSFKETNKFMRRAAVNFTTYIMLRGRAIYTGVYEIMTKMEKNEKGTWGVYTVKNAGTVQDENLYNFAKTFSSSLRGKTIVVNREGVVEDTPTDTPF